MQERRYMHEYVFENFNTFTQIHKIFLMKTFFQQIKKDTRVKSMQNLISIEWTKNSHKL